MKSSDDSLSKDASYNKADLVDQLVQNFNEKLELLQPNFLSQPVEVNF